MAGIIGYLTKLDYSTDAGSTYTTAGQLTEITPPEETVTDVKTTHLASPSAAHEYICGLIEGGELGFKIHFDKVKEAAFRALRNTRTTFTWRITFPDGVTQGSTITGVGYFKSIGKAVPIDDKLEAEFKVKVSGLPAFVQGT